MGKNPDYSDKLCRENNHIIIKMYIINSQKEFEEKQKNRNLPRKSEKVRKPDYGTQNYDIMF